MVIQHVLHGFLIIIVVFFGLPAILSLATSTMAGGKFSISLSLRFISKAMRIMLHSLAATADAIASQLSERYPEQESWLKPVLKDSFVAVFVLGTLYLVSILTNR